ncbi:MAG: hypothetical protein NC930_00060 [Candidatus Omnitrophica bacterium]|nr:hypothetical protein [Candidatus Omnitrophota bacterium]
MIRAVRQKIDGFLLMIKQKFQEAHLAYEGLNLQQGSPRLILFVISFLFVSSYAIYFRTYKLHRFLNLEYNFTRTQAEKIVTEKMTKQLRSIIDLQFPQMADREKSLLAEERVKAAKNSEKDKFEEAVRQTQRSMVPSWYMTSSPPQSRHYLLEADPYYYYYFTKNLCETGKPGPPLERRGVVFNPLRRFPMGMSESALGHSYVGYYWFRAAHFFNSKIDLMESLNYVPLILVVLVIFVFFVFCRVMQLGLLAAFLGSLALVGAPIFIQRSQFGWYDTDPYNYIFPFSILAVYLWGVGGDKRWLLGSVAAGFLTGLYSNFWPGWPFIFYYLSVSGSVIGCIVWFFRRKFMNSFIKSTLGYILAALSFLMFFMPSTVLWAALMEPLRALPLFASKSGVVNLWPNALLAVGETKEVSLRKLVYLIGNQLTLWLAGMGVVLTLGSFFVRQNILYISQWFLLMVLILPLLMLSLNVERFTLLFVIPMSIFVAAGIERAYELLGHLFCLFIRNRPFQQIFRVILGGSMLLIFLPAASITAHISAQIDHTIMNDTWFDALSTIRQKTPQHSVVISWWPPGHFITSVAERAVFTDGGSQHLRETYWVAKGLLEMGEDVAVGIFRMLNISGASATSFLESLGFPPSKIVGFILQIVPHSKGVALKMLEQSSTGLSLSQMKHLVDLTHGNTPPRPNYILMYNDMIDQTLALTFLAYWDFDKAEAIMKAPRTFLDFKSFPSPSKAGPVQKKTSLQQILESSGCILKYTPEAELVRREGDKLYFGNGLMVDLTTMDSYVALPEKLVSGRPISFFYMQGGQLVQKENAGERVDASALLISRNGRYTSVIADPKLIRSVLFRLWYLNGAGLNFFKPFYEKADPANQTRILVFEIDWPAFERFQANEVF